MIYNQHKISSTKNEKVYRIKYETMVTTFMKENIQQTSIWLLSLVSVIENLSKLLTNKKF